MGRFATLPKVELHLHVEGAIPVDALWRIIQEHGGHPDLSSLEDLKRRYAYTDFAHFIDTWVWMNGFLDTYEAFTAGAAAVAEYLRGQTVVYAEASFSPSDFARHGLVPQELALAIRRGLDTVHGVEVALIADLVRDSGPERAGETLGAVLEVADEAGVIGIGIGGMEGPNPPEPFADVYRAAREAGLHRTAHAGEAAGPANVWGALEALNVERIGHGVRSVEDPALVEFLVERQIPLEVCPTSNIRTGVVAGWGDHPARHLIEAGALVTLNSDDPAMFDCTIVGEYQAAADHFGLSDQQIRAIAGNAVRASWAPASTKERIAKLQDLWWDGAWSIATLGP